MCVCVMSQQPRNAKNKLLCERREASDEEGSSTSRKEKNRVAAQRSRKKQTQRADLLHQACEVLEQRNRKLRREVDSLSEEQRRLSEALRLHEPFCPIMHCCAGPQCEPGNPSDRRCCRCCSV